MTQPTPSLDHVSSHAVPSATYDRTDVSNSADGMNHDILPTTEEHKSVLADRPRHVKRTWGILADSETGEVPGTVVLLSKNSTWNIPLGLHHDSKRSSVPAGLNRPRSHSDTKRTRDGKIVLYPQPDDSGNDPLNWPVWRRNAALLSLGFYCMIGGGVTPILAAGFHQVANDLNISYNEVARTTGLYMMGLGIGSVLFSPTAILLGKRPVYLLGAILFIVSSLWCGLSPNYTNLATARVFQGIAVSPVECLPSATITEIFFLHERAFRIGIYTLLLLGGKNLVPLVSAAIIQGPGWRWAFYVLAAIVAFAGILLFLFVPETFWDRTPRPKGLSRRSTSKSSASRFHKLLKLSSSSQPNSPVARTPSEYLKMEPREPTSSQAHPRPEVVSMDGATRPGPLRIQLPPPFDPNTISPPAGVRFAKDDPSLPTLHNLNSPYYNEVEKNNDYLDSATKNEESEAELPPTESEGRSSHTRSSTFSKLSIKRSTKSSGTFSSKPSVTRQATTKSYTSDLRQEPAKPWVKTLNPWNGRLSHESWWRAAIRPFILFAYPAVLWSALVYSLSVGWLIVLSESVAAIYENRASYNFTPLQVGLVYMSPFIGGVLGTAVAGKFSDVVVRFMARRNHGVYEPEFRLVMAIPIAISTAIGLMGFGWSAEERDAWIVPTVFFGVISFGCSLGSTTAITFCVDSYRQYAGEALVTLNFSKNILHGLVWSLFFPHWLGADGPKRVFVAIGGIQIACLLFTIPMYILGKRARMWTVRKDMMSRF